MSKSDYIQKLLKGIEVEWKDLGALTKDKFWIMPATPKFDENEKIPYITSKNIRGGNIDFAKTKFISNSDYLNLSRNRPILTGDILISMIGTIGEVARVKKTDLDFYGQNMYLIRLNKNLINSDYFLHFFDSPSVKNHFNSVKNNSGQGYLKANDIEKLQIPIPPLYIQAKIVQILDLFTELTAELTAELISRKQQHAYYLENLLSFNDNKTKWKTLGEVTLSTSNIKWRDTDSAYRYIDLSSVSRENNSIIETSEITAENAPSRAQKLVIEDDIIFATTRPTQQRLCLINNEYSGEIASTGYCVLRAKPDVVLPKWIYFYLSSTKFRNYVEEVQSGAAYPAVSDTKVKNFNFPIPSLAEQERIITILDKFDALTTDVLPREIALRQQQYEYYRELLLSFPKTEVVDHD